MKKLYFFLMLLLSFVGVTQVFAQDDDVEITVDMNNGHWVDWNEKPGASAYARSWFSDSTPVISILCMQGGNKSKDVRGNEYTTCANNMSAWGDDAVELRFYNNFGTYEIMVDKGWYLKSVDFDFNCETSEGMGVTIDQEEIVVSPDGTTNEHVSWTNSDTEIYSVRFVVTKQGGSNGFARTSNFKVVVAPLSEYNPAIAALQEIFKKYENVEFTVGTMPGQYDEEAVQAFYDARDAADENSPMFDTTLTDEEYEALGQALEDAYNAVLATKVPMTLESGYYRIKSALSFTETYEDEEGNQIIDEDVAKYMGVKLSDGKFNVKWYTPEDWDSEAPALWKVAMTPDSLFDIVNGAYEYHFADTNPFTLTEGSDSLIAIDPVGTDENDITTVAFRLASKAAGAYNYLHISGHKSGQQTVKNSNGDIVVWNFDAPASQWIFEPVDEAEAQAVIAAYADIKERELMLLAHDTLMTAAKRELQKALKLDIVKMTINSETKLITSADQLSSPYSDSDEGTDFGALIDGNTTTYWHSDWHNGNQANHTHYLQVALTEAIEEDIAMTITRRPVSNDHITAWSVFGSSSADAEDADWTYLTYITTPYGSNTETLNSLPFSTKGFQYLRFYIDGTTSNRGYGHVSEFQLNPASLDAEQTVTYLEQAIALNNIVGQQSLMKRDDIQQEQVDALRAAYNALMDKFVSNEALRNALADTKDTDKLVVKGNNPGQWSDDSQAAEFRALYTEAQAYYDDGVYEKETIDSYVTRLTEMKKAILESANGVQTGKWYKIRFASEEEFETNGWDLVAGKSIEVKDAETNQTITQSQALWSKVAAIATGKSEKTYYKRTTKGSQGQDSLYTDSIWVYSVWNKTNSVKDFIGTGNNVYFINESELENADMALFRFVAVGDTAYAIQNKASGLFVKAIGNGYAIQMDAHPSLFKTSAVGLGKNLIAAHALTDDTNQFYLHGQKAGNTLVTYNATAISSASALYLEEVESVADNYVAQASILLKPGSVNGICYPVELKQTASTVGQAWTVNEVNGNEIKLAKITESIIAGRPFIFVFGNKDSYDEEADVEPAQFEVVPSEFVKEPQTNRALKGTYARTGLHKGDVYCKGNNLVTATVDFDGIMVTNPVYVAANSAYISNEPKIDHTAEVSIIFDENAEDGIQTALANVSKAGAVYTIDGRLVSRRATINELSRFGKGLYILNGTKIVVK